MLEIVNHFKILQETYQKCWCDVCQIYEQFVNYKPKCHGFQAQRLMLNHT